MLNIRNTSSKVFFAGLGAVYLTAFSNLDINIFLKGYVVIVPVQLLALVYGIYVISTQKRKRSH